MQPAICNWTVIFSLFLALGSGPLPARAADASGPTLGNESVTYRWATTEQGCGLIGIEDRAHPNGLLAATTPAAPWWRVKLKDGRTFANTDLPCEVDVQPDKLTFTWNEHIRVTVVARLGANDRMLKARIKVDAVTQDVGLRDVVFPVVGGIRPLAEDAADDRLLHAFRTGYTEPTPLTTGKPVNMQYCISYYMQFTALLGGGRGLYIGDHDPTAAWKDMSWTPHVDSQTLSYAISHPVLGWGGAEPVRHYEPPGECVVGPFAGDWYDAARLYRAWAVTAPWCAKGPMHQRDDYPNWFLNINYWAIGHLGDHADQRREFLKRDLFDFPITVTHDYGYYGQPYQHDINPEYFPPRPGSENYRRVVGELRDRGARVIPYVLGWMWNAASDDYRLRGGKEKGAMIVEDGQSVLWAELSPAEENIAMCPASQIWRDKLTEVAVEHVQRYRTGGVYFDYFSDHMNDCHNPNHGHAVAGGDYWSRGVHDLYQQVRDTVHKIDPEAMFCGENPAEFCIDVLDGDYTTSYPYDAPIWQVVYHDYTQLIYGLHWMEDSPLRIGRQWLLGQINGVSGGFGYPPAESFEPESIEWLLDLLRCHHEFARPYLGYGEMLRPPIVTGELPEITHQGGDGPFTVSAVEGSAWRAPDGSVGIFFFNYQDQPHQFTWQTDVEEIAEFDASTKLQMTQWTADEGATPLRKTRGGTIGGTLEIAPRGLIALKLEVIE